MARVRPSRGADDEAITVHGRANHRAPARAGGGLGDGGGVPQARHQHGTFYAWKAKYGGLDVSQARKLKALEDENARLKKLLAEAMLDVAVLRDVTAKKW
jgi:hypothetical protein